MTRKRYTVIDAGDNFYSVFDDVEDRALTISEVDKIVNSFIDPDVVRRDKPVLFPEPEQVPRDFVSGATEITITIDLGGD